MEGPGLRSDLARGRVDGYPQDFWTGAWLARVSVFRHLGVLSYKTSAGTSKYADSALVRLPGEGHARLGRLR
jgi:hypothetical protein